jgi:regulator of protease activity HflC (stomatin/prohibitin superfamily)
MNMSRYSQTKTVDGRYGEPPRQVEVLNVFAVVRDSVIALLVLIILLGSFSVISPSERAVKITLGTASNTIYQPGPQLKWPLVSSFKTYDLAPHTADMVIEEGPQGAITKDNQTVGISAKIIWSYNGDQIKTLVSKYPDADKLATIVTNTVYGALKAEIGKYSIYDLAGHANNIAKDTRTAAALELQPYPIILNQLNLTNWDWSKDFDDKIKETMNAQQRVATAKADADRTEQEQKKQTLIAEATARSTIATAEGNKQAAELNAAAKRAEGQGISDYNKLIAQNLDTEIRFRQLEIEKIKAEKWNGAYVPEYVPLTAAGGIVNLPPGVGSK